MSKRKSNVGQPASAMLPFETAMYSLAERGKVRCGDHGIIKTMETLVLVAVADGVGSRPCDYRASQTVCTGLSEHFSQNRLPIRDRLHTSVSAAHTAVQNQPGDCAGMLATFVAAVWEIGADHAHIVSVGDSRIYRASALDVVQLTTDDASAEVYTRFGKPHIAAGAAVTYPVITKAMGQPQPLAIEVQKIPFEPGDQYYSCDRRNVSFREQIRKIVMCNKSGRRCSFRHS